jgi:predicted membrane channel-forming protein YqfA (hemolysin III family)
MVELVIKAAFAVSVASLVVAYFGLLLRSDPYEAPNWVVVGLFVGMAGMVVSAIAALVAKALGVI